MAKRVERDTGGFITGWSSSELAPSERPHPSHELGKLKGLRQVIIRAELEPVDFFLGASGSRDHQNRRSLFAQIQEPAHLIAAHPGNIAVEQHDLVVIDVDGGNRITAIGDSVGRDGVQCESVVNCFGEVRFVFNDEYANDSSRGWLRAAQIVASGR